MHILHIDDDTDFLAIGKTILEKLGDFTVTGVQSGKMALDLLARDRFDAVISDYQMPDINGIVLLKKIREMGLEIPFIIFTGKSREEVVIEALNNGADYFIQKGGDVHSVFTELSHQIIRAVHHCHTKRSLSLSQEKYRRILETAQEGIWEIDREYRTIYVNARLATMLGYSPEEIIGRTYTDFMLAEDSADHQEKTRERWSGTSRSYERRFVHRDGHIIWTIVSAVPVFEGDEIVGSFGMISDITQRKQAEIELAASETFYRAIFENTGSASIIIEEDTTISLANTQWEILSGYRKEELEGKVSWTIFVVPEDLNRMKEFHKIRRIDSDSAPWIYEFRFVNRNNEIRNIVNHVAMIPGTRKSIASLLDITDRKKAEDAVRASEKKFRDLFSDIIDGVILYEIRDDGSAGRILEANTVFSQWVTGMSSVPGICTPDQFLISGIFSDKTCNMNPDSSFTFYRDIRGHDSSTIPVEVHLRIVSYEGRNAGLAVLHDISERRQFESERNALLGQIEKNLGELAILNDGIRNPLSVISSLVEEEAPGIEAKVQEQIRSIDEMVKNLDMRWNESEKVLRFLRLHYQIGQ